jgi:hypothetical protein
LLFRADRERFLRRIVVRKAILLIIAALLIVPAVVLAKDPDANKCSQRWFEYTNIYHVLKSQSKRLQAL